MHITKCGRERYSRLVLSLLIACLVGTIQGDAEIPSIPDDPNIGSEKGALHVVTSIECGKDYFIYQSLALKYTFDRVGQPGKLTRIMSCQDPDQIDEEDKKITDSLVVPNWTVHPKTGDHYHAYNKPVGIIYWLAQRKPTAEWTLILDPDMQLRSAIRVEDFNLPEGYAASSTYSYLKGANNALAEKHIPNVPPRNDSLAGPRGRKADYAGAFYLLRTKDLVKIAPLWLKYTEDVRNDPDAWNLTGDTYVKPGGKAWISEMYGYIFAAASCNIWHIADETIQYYPDYQPRDIPKIIHYGLHMKLGSYTFDKHSHFDFRALECPPWNMNSDRSYVDDKGLFTHPPFPHTISEEDARARYAKLMIIEAVNVINEALCKRHRAKCPPSAQLKEECNVTDRIAKELEEEYNRLHQAGVICYDENSKCQEWAAMNQCTETWAYMDLYCRVSCQKCRTGIIPTTEPAKTDKQDTQPELKLNEAVQQLPADEDGMDDHQGILSQQEVDKQLSRCHQLGAKELMTDTLCNRLVQYGYARLEDFTVLSLAHKEVLVHDTAPLWHDWFRFLAIASFAMLIIAYSRRVFLRRKNTMKRM